jgi:hypothetical protein
VITTLYRLRPPPGPWGDYGCFLRHGISRHAASGGGFIRLKRTGPFMAPITFPGAGDIVVKSWLRERLLKSGLGAVEFRPVIKRCIVHVDWHLWDCAAAIPKGGAIFNSSHSESASRMIGELFELCPAELATTVSRGSELRVVHGSWGEADIFRAQGNRVTFVTRRARHWFEANVGEYVAFEDVPLVWEASKTPTVSIFQFPPPLF